jgi:hypothetical protein
MHFTLPLTLLLAASALAAPAPTRLEKRWIGILDFYKDDACKQHLKQVKMTFSPPKHCYKVVSPYVRISDVNFRARSKYHPCETYLV